MAHVALILLLSGETFFRHLSCQEQHKLLLAPSCLRRSHSLADEASIPFIHSVSEIFSLHCVKFTLMMSPLRGQGRVKFSDYHASRRRIREGTASNRDEELFEIRTGKLASSVKKESSKQRARRLEKACVRSTKRLKNESEKESRRRKEADKIRHQLRRSCYYPRNQTISADERKALKLQLQKLCKYPKAYPSGWWSPIPKCQRKEGPLPKGWRHVEK